MFSDMFSGMSGVECRSLLSFFVTILSSSAVVEFYE